MRSSKKRQRKKKSLQRYRALSDNCMENKVFVSKNDRQDRSLTGQVRDQAGHCPLTGRYLQPCLSSLLVFQNNKTAALLVFQTSPVGVESRE